MNKNCSETKKNQKKKRNQQFLSHVNEDGYSCERRNFVMVSKIVGKKGRKGRREQKKRKTMEAVRIIIFHT